MPVSPSVTVVDVIVIGGGPAGYATALYGASAGLHIALVEKEKVGGTCLHRGCIPAKELLETAHVFRTVAEASTFGVNAGAPTIDWGTAMARKQQVVDTQWKGLESTIKGRKITIVPGTGTFKGGESTSPAVGESGREERVAELRLETVFPEERHDDVVAALRGSHPYEEPAFDVYPLL